MIAIRIILDSLHKNLKYTLLRPTSNLACDFGLLDSTFYLRGVHLVDAAAKYSAEKCEESTSFIFTDDSTPNILSSS